MLTFDANYLRNGPPISRSALGVILSSALTVPMLWSSIAVAGEVNPAISVPGTGYEIIAGESQLDAGGDPKQDLTSSIASWLSEKFDLASVTKLPTIELASSATLVAVRYGALGGRKLTSPLSGNAEFESDIVALYDDRSQKIYLSDGWTGRAPAEISALVHELVHHLQNLGGETFACPAEREKLAYRAQAQFLSLFGQSLESEFDVDPMTLLVRTTCAM